MQAPTTWATSQAASAPRALPFWPMVSLEPCTSGSAQVCLCLTAIHKLGEYSTTPKKSVSATLTLALTIVVPFHVLSLSCMAIDRPYSSPVAHPQSINATYSPCPYCTHLPYILVTAQKPLGYHLHSTSFPSLDTTLAIVTAQCCAASSVASYLL